MLKLGLHKRVFILTLRNEISKIPMNRTAGGNAPPLPPPQPIVHPTTKEVQV